jgi:hypothetical protein
METKRWTLGVVLAAAVSLWGVVEADASPFSSYVLSDDLGNMVRGTAAEASTWETESGATDDSGGADSSGADSGGDSTGDASGDGKGKDWTKNNVKDNNGHGNNEDGVDSSNPSQGGGGPNGAVDESCTGEGECIDDEMKK